MLKKIVLFVGALICSLYIGAQEVKPQYDFKTSKWGLFNERVQQWVLRPTFSDVKYMGAYNGVRYFKVQNPETNLWGIISSDNYNEMRVPFYFNKIVNSYDFYSDNYSFPVVPLIGVQKNADWGLMEIGTKSCHYIRKCQYKDIGIYGYEVHIAPWNGKNFILSISDLKTTYENIVKNEKEQKEREEKARREAAAKAQKERELASFTIYAKKYVTPKVEAWQKKGEFEKISAYQERVTGANREEKIRVLTKEAEDMFIQENAALNLFTGLKLDTYDSENEVFAIQSPKFGQLLVQIPIDEGAEFKEAFNNHNIVTHNPVFFIENDKIALRSVDFMNKNTLRTYHYSNQRALNYKQYEIDLDLLDIAPVRITSSTTSSSALLSEKPVCEILSPAKGSSYSTPTIRVRYLVKAAPETDYTVHFLVGGIEVEPIEQEQKKGSKSKAVTIAQGVEKELPMPQEIGREVPVSLQVKTADGIYAEPKTIMLKYAGEKPKPTLHLLAVGVSNYPAEDLTNLTYASKDAQDFVQTISNSDLSMYKEMQPTLLLNNTATTQIIKRELTKLTSRVAQGDVVMLYFSGHGINQDKERYFMTYNSSAEEYYNALDFNFIRDRMTTMSEDKKCRVIIFMDACHSGAMLGTKGAVKDITFAAPGIIGFYSSTASEQSAETDKMQNGVFTRVLLDGLKGGAKNKDGQVTIHQLDAYVKQHVAEETNGKQTPLIENATGDAVLFQIKK